MINKSRKISLSITLKAKEEILRIKKDSEVAAD
jgi:hypothetical protein